MDLLSIEICAGVGMLGEGLRAGLRHLGIAHRTICYVEREAYPDSNLAARMQEGSLDDAPIWTDLLTFDASAWRGAVDCIVAGFPCQDLSVAGRRAGLDGARSGLFFNILDIAHDCGAQYLFLENVAGIASATATVVDEAAAAEVTGQSYRPAGAGRSGADERIREEDGVVLERAAARVVGELADRGWHAEWLTLSASDVGASHGRERWFCFAWRATNTGHRARAHQPLSIGGCDESADDCTGGEAMGHPDQQQQQQQDNEDRTEPRRESRSCTGWTSCDVGNTSRHGRHQGWTESVGQQGRLDAPERGRTVAHACSPGSSQRAGGGELREQPSEQEPGPALELCGRPFFAPGPADPAWRDILQQWPELAPALEPDFRGVVNGMAFAMDESRAQRLKCIGNGVVPLQAAAAFVVLIQRAKGEMT